MSDNTPKYRPTLWKVAAVALAGLLVGVMVAVQVTSSPPRYRATATMALLPSPQLASAELPDYWEVLARGQATRTSALVLGQPRWLAAASVDSGEPADSLGLAAGAIPDTSLISVTMEADSAKSAELALRSVMSGGSTEAAGVSGPFVLDVVRAPEGSAVSLAPDQGPVLVAGGLAGLLLGSGLGLVADRALWRRRRATATGDKASPKNPGATGGAEEHPLTMPIATVAAARPAGYGNGRPKVAAAGTGPHPRPYAGAHIGQPTVSTRRIIPRPRPSEANGKPASVSAADQQKATDDRRT